MKTPTPPAAESALKTPRVTALVRELYRLKSNTLRYPCETALRQLAEELETEHAAAQQRIARLQTANELLDAALEDLLCARVVEVSEQFANVRVMAQQALVAARLALRHPERT